MPIVSRTACYHAGEILAGTTLARRADLEGRSPLFARARQSPRASALRLVMRAVSPNPQSLRSLRAG
jgi:hypothetical protein